ncbi:MAG: hypothetical protein ACREP2_00130, partial [Rhodanobacteraceae bacterium]
ALGGSGCADSALPNYRQRVVDRLHKKAEAMGYTHLPIAAREKGYTDQPLTFCFSRAFLPRICTDAHRCAPIKAGFRSV